MRRDPFRQSRSLKWLLRGSLVDAAVSPTVTYAPQRRQNRIEKA
jgi:hypothetical protein